MKMQKKVGFFLSVLVTVIEISARRACNTDDEFQNSHVGLLVSPIMTAKKIREIEIYWNHTNYRPGDVISVYTTEPAGNLEPVYTVVPNAPSGLRKTGLQAEFVPSSNLAFQSTCLKYHVAWLRNGVVRKKNCLRTRPTWMADRKDILGPLTINKLFLPGTHDSASYGTHKDAAQESILEKYVITQDLDVLGQLIHGVRYLDIRVGYYPNTPAVWWVNHGFYPLMSLQKIIDDVKTFLDNTEEIVIFDIQEFPAGFKNTSIHHQLVAHLEGQFAGYFLPRNSYPFGWFNTLNMIWQSGRRLIIGYDNKSIVSRHDSIWPSVTHQWGNVRNVKDLYKYLNRMETAASNGPPEITPRSAMAQLTPNTWDVILNRLGSLRQMAETININVTNWYSTLWQRSANIVAVDFVRSTGIVETAIEWNEKRNGIAC